MDTAWRTRKTANVQRSCFHGVYVNKIAILGGGGFVGRAVGRALRKRGAEVFCLNRTGDSNDSLVPGFAVDRSDPSNVVSALERLEIDTVIDTIAYTEADTLPLFVRLSDWGRRLVLLSSVDVYAAFGRVLGTESAAIDDAPLTELSPLRASRYPYSATGGRHAEYDKIPLEEAARASAGMKTTIVRLPMMFGPGDPRRRFQTVADALVNDRPLRLPRSEAIWRMPLLYIEDAADGIAAACLHNQPVAHPLLLGADQHPRWAEHAAAFAVAAGKHLDLSVDSDQMPKRQNLVLDSTLTRTLLDWAPQTPPMDAYSQTWMWERELPRQE